MEIHVGEIEEEQLGKAEQEQSLAEKARRKSLAMFSELRSVGQRLERLDNTLFQVASSRFEDGRSSLRAPPHDENFNSAAVTVRRESERHLERTFSFASADLRAPREYRRGYSGSDLCTVPLDCDAAAM